MTAVVYTARRSLVSGHVIGQSYSLNLFTESPGGLQQRRDTKRRRIEPLSGRNAETLRFYGRRQFEIRLAPLTGDALLNVIEFLDSVEDGSFSFDPYGTLVAPSAPITADLLSDGYDLARFSANGAGGANDYFTISFTVVEAL